ncbi:hypothetical protein ACFSWE_16600 [Leucobacter albus]|uniref:Uncharacterized protein n=1 Tax=Leucobacter albus TaxID=272210 RepID=A0ABW3TS80_9MICO
MTATRLYTVVDAYTDDDYYTTTTESGHVLKLRRPIMCPHPDEWVERCKRLYGEQRAFFLPAAGRLYKSRSAAVARRDLIRYWGGKAEVLECTPGWESLEAANLRRKAERFDARIAKKQAEVEELARQRDIALGYEAVSA